MGKTIVVTKQIAAADFTILDTGSTAAQTILDEVGIVLTEGEIKSMINVSTTRNSEMVDIKEKVVEQHAAALPAGITAAGIELDFTYLGSLKKSHTGLADQAAKLNVLIGVAENNLYVKLSNVMKNVALLGATDKVLADIAKDNSIKYHPHTSAKAAPSNFKIGPSVIVTQGGVVVEKYFTNKARAVLSILTVNGDINDTLVVNPFSGVLIPLNWTSIVITNLSATESGSYDIYLK